MLKLGYCDELAFEREASVDRAHAVEQKEWVRVIHWRDDDGATDALGHITVVKLEIIGFVVNLICEPEGKDGAWKVLGVMSNFTVLRPGQFLQPVERVVFMWERTDFEGPGTFPLVTKAVDYNDTVGEYYQANVRQCAQVVQTYVNRIDPEEDLDPSALVPEVVDE